MGFSRTSTRKSSWSGHEDDPKAHEEQDWYHGLLPRADISSLLEKDGDFLLRASSISDAEPLRTIISIKWKSKIHHYILVECLDGSISLDKHRYGTVLELVGALMYKKLPITSDLGALLINPIVKQDWELRHNQIVIGKMLGEGAFGGVYKGSLTIKKRKIPVAVKVSKGNAKMSSKVMIAEVCKEARIMRHYQHMNIVNFYGVAVEKSRFPGFSGIYLLFEEPIMLVMELADTGALDSYLRGGNNVTLLTKLKYSFDTAKGLEYLHQNGCIHRDVAARNCLLHAGTVKISDFGLSKQLSDHAHKYKLKDLHQKLPIRWLAPEVLVSATYSCKSDVFSFGILLWEIFMDGAIPYPDMTLGEVSAKVRTGYRMSPPDRMPKFVREVMTNQCFPQAPEDRGNMFEIRESMENVIERRTVPSSVYQSIRY